MNDSPILKPMYTPGFASPEHYHDRENLGPWSDIYSVGATMYSCLAAAPPPAADARQEKDTYQPATTRWKGQYSDQLLEIVDWCLCLNFFYRPQSVFALQKALTERVPPKAPDSEPPSAPGWFGKLVGGMRKGGSE
jgi:serine/threonine protein kinase